jgi:hypothetical protein
MTPEEMERYPEMKAGRFVEQARASWLVCCERPNELVDVLEGWYGIAGK